MKLLKFRIAGTFSGKFCVGQNYYNAGQEFTLREDQAKRWISEADITGGWVIPLGEAGREQGAFIDSATASYVAGKDGTLRAAQDFERFYITLNPTFVATGATGIAKLYPDCDCVFMGVEFPQVTPVALAANNYNIDIRRYTNGVTDAGSMLETPGTSLQSLTGCLFYDASAATYTDETTDANDADANDVVLSSMQTTDFLYIGWYAPFDGFAVTGGAWNSNAAVAALTYPAVSSAGVVTWTAMTVTDGTISAGATMGQAGAITWNMRPGDWKRMAITSGGTEAYWVRFATGAALDASTTVSTIDIITRLLPGYDNAAIYVKKGDLVSVDSPVYTAVSGASQTIVLHFGRVR